jgi:hypothetical protein
MSKTQFFGNLVLFMSHFVHRSLGFFHFMSCFVHSSFCLVPFKSRTILVTFSLFMSKMNEINGAEWL